MSPIWRAAMPGPELRFIERKRAEWRACARALPSGEALLAIPRQRLDRAEGRLAAALRGGHDRHRIALARLAHRLAGQSPQARMARAGERLASLGERMARAGLCRAANAAPSGSNMPGSA